MSLLKKDGEDLFGHYRHLLEELGKEKGMLGLIFTKAQNKFQDPVKLRRLIVDLIDKEDWSTMNADVKGDAYEGLLEKNAQDTKSGAGQYFTPRPLIAAMVEAIARVFTGNPFVPIANTTLPHRLRGAPRTQDPPRTSSRHQAILLILSGTDLSSYE